MQIFRSKFESFLRSSIEPMGEKNPLRDACEYALTNGGKRLRPILTLMVADAVGRGFDVLPAALSVEYFHTASLIADDLPCMDDDALRRNRPSLHKVFGESVAILASYTLIAAGYGGIHKNCELMKTYLGCDGRADQIATLALEAATRCAGLKGATNGQFLDLYPPDASAATVQKVIYQKTVTLFEISFLFGWLFGGGDLKHLIKVRACAYHLGMAFQIQDDLQDDLQDASRKNEINIVLALGRETALSLFEQEMAALTAVLRDLGLWTDSFQEMVSWLRLTLTTEAQRAQRRAQR